MSADQPTVATTTTDVEVVEVVEVKPTEDVVITIKDERVEDVVKDLLLLLPASPSIIDLVRHTMEVIEKLPVKGVDQRELAVKAIKSCIEILPGLDDVAKEALLAVSDATLRDTIDLVVDASKGKLNVNKVVKTAQSCIVSCFNSWCAKPAK